MTGGTSSPSWSRCMRSSLQQLVLQTVARVTKPFAADRRTSSRGDLSRILIIRPDHIGDILFTTPALRALRSKAPHAHLTYMVGPWAYAIVKENPHLDEIMVCPFPGFTRRPKKHILHPYMLLRNYSRSLQAQSFDVALILRFDHWWGAMLAYWAGIPRRVGYALPQMNPFLTEAAPHVSGRHEVEQNICIVATAVDDDIREVGPLEFSPTKEDLRSACTLLTTTSANQSFVCLHPGAGAPVKLWRHDAFAELADTITQKHGVQIIITGSAGERDLAEGIAQRMESNALVLAGQTSLGELGAVMGRCELVIGVDSGPLHLAVSQGVPTIHLFGPVDHRAFGPWGDPTKHLVVLSDMDCIPCNRLDYQPQELEQHTCVRSITVDQVLKAADSLLTGDSQAGP